MTYFTNKARASTAYKCIDAYIDKERTLCRTVETLFVCRQTKERSYFSICFRITME
ncbi:hypothetical protein BDA99DRAFT_496984 [Phascolomyces articulosus]|uniref:Uncharacterized protein n=1 Tax=Phascolomyces articulosus TaxID=60185 RepID=A0AAD5KUZ5_9FUNG|nr:hypothetical protein BDA99DRAFT_496984 [Phascolomyces articulosus]